MQERKCSGYEGFEHIIYNCRNKEIKKEEVLIYHVIVQDSKYEVKKRILY